MPEEIATANQENPIRKLWVDQVIEIDQLYPDLEAQHYLEEEHRPIKPIQPAINELNADYYLMKFNEHAVVAMLGYAHINEIKPWQIGMILDIDNVGRATLNWGLSGKPGGMTSMPFGPEKDIRESHGVHILGFATNNPIKQH